MTTKWKRQNSDPGDAFAARMVELQHWLRACPECRDARAERQEAA